MNPSRNAEGAACLGSIEAEIERMLSRLDPVAPRLTSLRQDVTLEMRVFYRSDGGFIPFELSPILLSRLSALDCTLKIQIGHDRLEEAD